MNTKRKTFLAAAVPSTVLIGGSNLIQLIFKALKLEVPEESSYVAVTAIYSIVKAIQAWIASRRRNR